MSNAKKPERKKPAAKADKANEGSRLGRRNGNDTRLAGEPPLSFNYDRYRYDHCMAWAMVSPNFYFGPDEEAYARSRYDLVMVPGTKDTEGEVSVSAKQPGSNEPQADPEDTPELRQRYDRAVRQLASYQHARLLVPGETAPGTVVTGVRDRGNAKARSMTAELGMWRPPVPDTRIF